MSAQPSEDDSHDVIRLGGETAAEIDAAIAEHEAWKAAGRPGSKSYDEFMAEVFGGPR